MQGVAPALDGPEAGRFVMPTETTFRHWCADTLRMSAQFLGLSMLTSAAAGQIR